MVEAPPSPHHSKGRTAGYVSRCRVARAEHRPLHQVLTAVCQPAMQDQDLPILDRCRGTFPRPSRWGRTTGTRRGEGRVGRRTSEVEPWREMRVPSRVARRSRSSSSSAFTPRSRATTSPSTRVTSPRLSSRLTPAGAPRTHRPFPPDPVPRQPTGAGTFTAVQLQRVCVKASRDCHPESGAEPSAG